MPVAGGILGRKYVPTPVKLQPQRQNSLLDEKNTNFTNMTMSPTMRLVPPSPDTEHKSPPLIEQTSQRSKQKSRSKVETASNKTKWSKNKKIIVGCIIVAVIIALIIMAILLGVLLQKKSDTTTTTTTTASTYVTIAYWSFDGNTTELNNVYNAASMNSPSFFATTYNQPFVGNGRGLSLVSASSQYVYVSSPFLDLTHKSFTIELWIYPTLSSSTDYGIFGQCQCLSCSNQCLYIIIRSYSLYVSFMANDLSGNTTFTSNTWYHVAFVYNYATKQQILYVNGYQDAIKSNANPYQGTNGSLLIGASQVYLVTSYFNGYIDNFKITTRAKSATEISNAGSLTAYYSFDLPSPTYDSGPLGLNGTSNNTAIISGRVNQAMRFSGSSSYFYAYGFYQTAFAVYAAKSFSVSLWINPSNTAACTIVQTAYALSSYTCHNLLGFYSTLGYTAQIVAQAYAWPTIYGPFVILNTWTHISVTYSNANGLRLYVNGIYFGSTGTCSFSNTGYIMYFQLGYVNYCSSSSVVNGGYQGLIDEVYVHSREITKSEASAFANP